VVMCVMAAHHALSRWAADIIRALGDLLRELVARRWPDSISKDETVPRYWYQGGLASSNFNHRTYSIKDDDC
jgi:hypothetical protein